MSLASQEIDNRAAEWAAKQSLRALTPAEAVELDAWLAADIRHVGAYARAEAVLARLERMPGVAIEEISARNGEAEVNQRRRRLVLTGSIAASLAALGVFGSRLWRDTQEDEAVAAADFASGKGQTRAILLADGSTITLNTDSAVSVKLSKRLRAITLTRGEALFDVAKDRERPFIVAAGDTQVRAVGTSFTVSMLPEQPVQVLVRQGVVEVKHPDAAPLSVGAHSRAVARSHEPIVAEAVSTAKLVRDLAWQYGQIALDNQTLADASQEFARYSDVRIVVDASVANRTVTGLFVANDPVAFAKATASVLKLEVRDEGKEVRILAASETGGVGKL